jgi:hypothetical protein
MVDHFNGKLEIGSKPCPVTILEQSNELITTNNGSNSTTKMVVLETPQKNMG